MQILKFPCGAFFDITDSQRRFRAEKNKVVVHSTEKQKPRLPVHPDGKPASCGPFGCKRVKGAKHVCTDIDERVFITFCTGTKEDVSC